MDRNRLSSVVHTSLGLLLLAAAGLKLYGMNVAPFAQYGWLTAPWVQVLAVLWEVALGLWLLSGAHRAGAWAVAVGTFAAFAAVSGYLGWIGQANCGCFGAIQASPWHAFAVDVVALRCWRLCGQTGGQCESHRSRCRPGSPRCCSGRGWSLAC
jgi:hypothetical protein